MECPNETSNLLKYYHFVNLISDRASSTGNSLWMTCAVKSTHVHMDIRCNDLHFEQCAVYSVQFSLPEGTSDVDTECNG